MHTKPVLFVDNHQRQALEYHVILKQGMGTNGNLRTALGDRTQCCLSGFAFHLPRQPGQLHTQWLQPIAEVLIVLLRQNLGRCHQGNLGAGFNGLQGRQGGNHGFTRADISLNQAQHRHRLAQILPDIGHNVALGTCKAERQLLQKSLDPISRWQ